MLMKQFIILLFPLFLFGNNNCGEKPIKPKQKTYHSTFKYINTIEFKQWKKKILEWENCVKENFNKPEDTISIIKHYLPDAKKWNLEYLGVESNKVLQFLEVYDKDSNLIDYHQFFLRSCVSCRSPRLFPIHERYQFKYDSNSRLIEYIKKVVLAEDGGSNWTYFENNTLFKSFINEKSMNFDSADSYFNYVEKNNYIYHDHTSQIEYKKFVDYKLVNYEIWDKNNDWKAKSSFNLFSNNFINDPPSHINKSYVLDFNLINDDIYNNFKSTDSINNYFDDSYIDTNIKYAIYKKDKFLNTLYNILKEQLCKEDFYNLRNEQIIWMKKMNSSIVLKDKLKLLENRLNELSIYFNRYISYSNKDNVNCYNKFYKLFGIQKIFDDVLLDYKNNREIGKDLVGDKYFINAMLNIEKKQYQIAIDFFNKLTILYPDCAKVFFDRGCAFAEIEDNEKALINYTKAITLDSNNIDSYFNRGVIYSAEMRYDKAIFDFSQAILLDKNFSKAYEYRGNQYVKLKKYDNAFLNFKKACDLGNKDSCKKYSSKTKNKKDYLLKIFKFFLVLLIIFLIYKNLSNIFIKKDKKKSQLINISQASKNYSHIISKDDDNVLSSVKKR